MSVIKGRVRGGSGGSGEGVSVSDQEILDHWNYDLQSNQMSTTATLSANLIGAETAEALESLSGSEQLDALKIKNLSAAITANGSVGDLPVIAGVTFSEVAPVTKTSGDWGALNLETTGRKILDMTSAVADGTFLSITYSMHGPEINDTSYPWLFFGKDIDDMQDIYANVTIASGGAFQYTSCIKIIVKVQLLVQNSKLLVSSELYGFTPGVEMTWYKIDEDIMDLTAVPLEVWTAYTSVTQNVDIEFGELKINDLT